MTVADLKRKLEEFPDEAQITVAIDNWAGADSSYISVEGNCPEPAKCQWVTITKVRY